MDPRLGGHGRGETESGPGQTNQKVTPGRCIGLNQAFKSRMNQVTDISTSLDHIAHHLRDERDLKDRGTCTSLERPLHLATHREPCLSSSSASHPAGCWCEFKPWTGPLDGANPPSRDTRKQPKAPLARRWHRGRLAGSQQSACFLRARSTHHTTDACMMETAVSTLRTEHSVVGYQG